MEKETRLFFVVDSLEHNEEIFETLEDAQAYRISVIGTEPKSRLRICLVRNAFKCPVTSLWNYEDFNNTFTTVKTL